MSITDLPPDPIPSDPGPSGLPSADDSVTFVAQQRGTRGIALALAVVSALIGIGVTAASGGVQWGWALIIATLAYVVLTMIVFNVVTDRRRATDRVVTAVVTVSFVLVLAPLLSLVWTVVSLGIERFDITFLTHTMRLTPADLGIQRTGGAVGGAYHATIGTLIVTAVATILSVPLGLFTAIYLVEYGRGRRLAQLITMMVDVMTGIPSIVAGLFAYALFELVLGPGTRSGLSGGVALTVLMTPVVVRSTEEMLRLVPNELREGAYALGVPKWRTIVRIVLPTSVAGILTGITLAIARVIGETAPLLVTVGLAQDTNYNPFSGRMTTLPVYTYYSYVQPGTPPAPGLARAWAAALVLVLIVAILFVAARVMATILRPKGLR